MNRLAALAPLAALLGCASPGAGLPPLRTVERVDPGRYAGTWYEIATIPQSFQKGCVGVTATYPPRPAGEVDVVNRSRKERLDGPERSATGRAWVADPATNAKLKVSFFFQSKFLLFNNNTESALNPSHPDTIRPIKTREQELQGEIPCAGEVNDKAIMLKTAEGCQSHAAQRSGA